MKITERIINRLEVWKEAGDRLVDIKLDRTEYTTDGNSDSTWFIWIYDFTLASGCVIKSAGDLESNWTKLIIASKRRTLLKEMKELDQADEKQGAIA